LAHFGTATDGTFVAARAPMMRSWSVLVALLTLVGCGGSTDENGAAGGGAGQTSTGGSSGSGGTGGTGGTGGSGGATGGAAGATGLGGWGAAGPHGVTKIPAGYSAIGPFLTESSVFFGVSQIVASGQYEIYRLDKATGNATVVAQYPDDATELAVTEQRLFVAGHEFQGEGPPADGWLKIVDVETGALSPFATFPQMWPSGLLVQGDHLWFIAGGFLRRIPTAGGEVEDVIAVSSGRPFAASSTRVYLQADTGITAYDSSTSSIVPIAPWLDAWSDLKLRNGSFYWRTMTENPALYAVPEAGGTPAEILPSSGIHFDVGNHLFREAGECPSGSVERVDLAGTTSEDWVTGMCWPGNLALDAQHLYFFDFHPDGGSDLVRVDVE
jgi:hypothetical protein